MSWIEGIGDEVPIFFILATFVIVIFMILAWKSTEVAEPSMPVLTFTISQNENPIVSQVRNTEDRPLTSDSNLPNHEVPLTLNPDLIMNLQTSRGGSVNQPENTTETTSADEAETSQEEDNTLRRRITSTQAENIISIKLMYMDDTHRIVESQSVSTLGEFKKTHFKNELGLNKVVKLIFNGQVLSEESSTLSQLGLDNNSVVHCLIHQPRASNNAPPPPNTVPGPTSRATEDPPPRHPAQQNAADAGIDIGGLLVPLFGVILGLVWYCRIAYATHFTAAATTALVGLSGLCVFSFFVIWYPTADQEG